MKEEIDWKKEILESRRLNRKFEKEPFRGCRKEFYAGNLSWLYVFQMEKVEGIWQVWSKRKYRANTIIIKRVLEDNQIKIIAKVRY